MKKAITIAVALLALTAPAAKASDCSAITRDDVLATQQAWGDGIVTIGAAADPKTAAIYHLDTLYGYDIGQVLFKPTVATAPQFRGTKEKALSYFVTGIIEEDQGFALAPYTKVRFDNEGFIIGCNAAQAMGNYFFTDTSGKDTKVEYSFGYIVDKNGKLKINLHHSSLPFSK